MVISYAKAQIEQRRFVSLIQLGDAFTWSKSEQSVNGGIIEVGSSRLLYGVLSYRWSMGALMPSGDFGQVDYAPNAEYFGGGNDVRAGRLVVWDRMFVQMIIALMQQILYRLAERRLDSVL